MRSITIHGIDKTLDKKIRRKAVKDNTSVNKAIKNLLAEYFGIGRKRSNDYKSEFADLFNSWTVKDEKAFNKAIRNFEKIDEEDWR